MASPNPVRFLSQDPAARIAWRFENSFETRMRQEEMEIYPCLVEAWEDALEYHRMIELRPTENPQGARVRDIVCRLFSLMPDRTQACRQTATMAAAFWYPTSARSAAGTRAFSHLALLCHGAVRDPVRADLRFGEVNPKTQAVERKRGQDSFGSAELARLLNFLANWPPEAERKPSPPSTA
ncbi:MAG: hypothetical protein JNL97_16875 [Verrucomicrobiales bacterium]|nr:hypothetical protein [Verrucomicrobiales bacterium]